MYQNAFGGRAPPGPAGGVIALPRPLSPLSREGREGKGKEGEGKGKGKERGREREVALEPPLQKVWLRACT